MNGDAEVISAIDRAFGAVARPPHFHGDLRDPEAADHDELLRSRDRESMAIEDVGNAGWDPFSDCLPEGLAYYLPALVRLALKQPPTPWDSYALQLVFHLSYNEDKNRLYTYCDRSQRSAVAVFLSHVIESRADLLEETESLAEFSKCLSIWQDAQPSTPADAPLSWT
jgi:hypothetical protein